jgi:hypothetical protein
MRGTSLGAAVALLIVGCGIDRDPTGPEDPGLTNAAFAYEPATGQLTSLPPMSVRRSAPTAVGLNGLLYVIGGMSATGETAATVEVYNPATNTWRTVTGMPTARWWPGAGAINGKVYAVGGHGEVTLPTTEVYTP